MHKFHSKIIAQVYYSAINIIFQHQDLNPLPSNSCFLARALPSLIGINLSSIDHLAQNCSLYSWGPNSGRYNHYFSL